jgi:hypothetical protein
MTAERILALLDSVRPVGTTKWIARCPAHDDQRPSLSICVTDDRLLLKCWAGCRVEDICGTVGIGLADLFTIPVRLRTRPVPAERRRVSAERALEAWRWAEINRIAGNLRSRDAFIRHVFEAFEAGTITEEVAMVCMADEFVGYSELEYRFDRLLRNENVLELWRSVQQELASI